MLYLLLLTLIIYWMKTDEDMLLPMLSAVIELLAGTAGKHAFGQAAAGNAQE